MSTKKPKNSKKCPNCKKVKQLSEFNKNGKYSSSYCRVCTKKKARRYYEDNPKYYAEKRDKLKNKRRKFVSDIKSKSGCVICKENDPVCLDFHHLRDKEHTIAQMIGDLKNEKQIQKEIDKCVVLCSNCHRKIHHYNISVDQLRGQLKQSL